MNPIKFLCAAAAALAASPAGADDWICHNWRYNLGSADGYVVQSTTISYDPSNGSWSVIHFMANGQSDNRSVNYQITNRPDLQNAYGWSGTQVSNPNFYMVGQLYTLHGRRFYQETAFDRAHLNKPVFDATAVCDPANGPSSSPGNAAPAPATAASPSGDYIQLYAADNGRALYVYIDIGPSMQRVLIDTGSTHLTVTESLAGRLLAQGNAHEGPGGTVTLADGSTHSGRNIIIDDVSIGAHVLHNIVAGVGPDNADMLLGMSLLNQIGRFTIDSANHKLIFG
jgi:clan AA aspartic protease (TIGR02281 family)